MFPDDYFWIDSRVYGKAKIMYFHESQLQIYYTENRWFTGNFFLPLNKVFSRFHEYFGLVLGFDNFCQKFFWYSVWEDLIEFCSLACKAINFSDKVTLSFSTRIFSYNAFFLKKYLDIFIHQFLKMLRHLLNSVKIIKSFLRLKTFDNEFNDVSTSMVTVAN